MGVEEMQSFLQSPYGVKINILRRATTRIMLKLKAIGISCFIGQSLGTPGCWGFGGAEMKIFIVLFSAIMIEISAQSVQHAKNEAY